MSANDEVPKRILLLTHARTASHLLERMLSAQPRVAYRSHPFAPARPLQVKLLEEGPLAQTSQQTKDELFKTWQDAFPALESFFSGAAEEGRATFLHCHPHFMLQPGLVSAYVHGGSPGEPWVLRPLSGSDAHSPDNPMVLPDATLLAPGTVPVLTIRHPITMVPSIYGTIRDVGGAENASDECQVFSTTLRWQRLLYDWYIKHGAAHSIKPLIVDADDFQGPGREAFMSRLCDATGLDKGSVIYTWSKASEKELSAMLPMLVQITKTILGSDGLIEGLDTGSLDLKAQESKWTERFGEEGAKEVKSLVERTMSEYEYLRARRFTV